MPEQIVIKLGIHIMEPELISTAYFTNVSHWYVCLYVSAARKQLGKNITAATNTRVTTEELLDTSFSTRSVSYKRNVGYSLFPELIAFMFIFAGYRRTMAD
jgi:hypothetical protein